MKLKNTLAAAFLVFSSVGIAGAQTTFEDQNGDSYKTTVDSVRVKIGDTVVDVPRRVVFGDEKTVKVAKLYYTGDDQAPAKTEDPFAKIEGEPAPKLKN